MVSCIKTHDGTIYVGTPHGLKKLNDAKTGLDNVDNVNFEHGFMHEAQDGTIYVGTLTQGFKKLVTKTSTINQINNTNGTLTLKHGINISLNDIKALLSVSDGDNNPTITWQDQDNFDINTPGDYTLVASVNVEHGTQKTISYTIQVTVT